MNDDCELLNAYVREGSESAFNELVRRHIDLVYSAAVRVAGSDTHLAKDVAQVVFIDLARKAKSLPVKVLLAGWLYRHACFTASKAVRTERRRMLRETIASDMSSLENDKESSWERIVPHLDAELNRLNQLDRDAVVLRFFKQQSFQAVGIGLGVSEDAAQMRVSRAVEKLRKALKKRGLLLSTSALVAGLSAEAAVVAPGGWVAAVGALSLAGASAAGAKFGFFSLMSAMKMKGALAAGAALLGITTAVVQYGQLGELREENRALRLQNAQFEISKEEKAQLKNAGIDPEEIKRLRKDQSELIRLRGEAASLRRALAEAHAGKPGQTKAAQPPLDLARTEDSHWVRSFSQELNASVPAGQSLLLGGWETKPGRRTFVLTSPAAMDAAGNVTADPNANQVSIESHFVELTEAAALELGLSQIRPDNADQEGRHRLLEDAEVKNLLKRIKEMDGSEILSSPRILTGNGTQGMLSIAQPFQAPNGHELHVGPTISVLPSIDPKTGGIELGVKAEMNLRTENGTPGL